MQGVSPCVYRPSQFPLALFLVLVDGGPSTPTQQRATSALMSSSPVALSEWHALSSELTGDVRDLHVLPKLVRALRLLLSTLRQGPQQCLDPPVVAGRFIRQVRDLVGSTTSRHLLTFRSAIVDAEDVVTELIEASSVVPTPVVSKTWSFFLEELRNLVICLGAAAVGVYELQRTLPYEVPSAEDLYSSRSSSVPSDGHVSSSWQVKVGLWTVSDSAGCFSVQLELKLFCRLAYDRSKSPRDPLQQLPKREKVFVPCVNATLTVAGTDVAVCLSLGVCRICFRRGCSVTGSKRCLPAAKLWWGDEEQLLNELRRLQIIPSSVPTSHCRVCSSLVCCSMLGQRCAKRLILLGGLQSVPSDHPATDPDPPPSSSTAEPATNPASASSTAGPTEPVLPPKCVCGWNISTSTKRQGGYCAAPGKRGCRDRQKVAMVASAGGTTTSSTAEPTTDPTSSSTAEPATNPASASSTAGPTEPVLPPKCVCGWNLSTSTKRQGGYCAAPGQRGCRDRQKVRANAVAALAKRPVASAGGVTTSSTVKSTTSLLPVLLLGGPGVGKTFLLLQLRSSFLSLPGVTVENSPLLALFGVAAERIGGRTIASWAGIGRGLGDVEDWKRRVSARYATATRTKGLCWHIQVDHPCVGRSWAIRNWEEVANLFLDDISPMGSHFLHKLEELARYMKRTDVWFGGIRIFATVDLLQVLSTDEPPLYTSYQFETLCGGFVLHLKKQHRFTKSEDIAVLDAVRTKDTRALFKATATIRKLGHNAEVRSLEENVDPFRRPLHLFPYRTERVAVSVSNYHKTILGRINTGELLSYHHLEATPGKVRRISTAPDVVVSVGLRIMFTQNNLDGGGIRYANGTLAVVTGTAAVSLRARSTDPLLALWLPHQTCTTVPVVSFMADPSISFKVLPVRLWSEDDDDEECEPQRVGIPFMLAEGITVHKSLGFTLDAVILHCDGLEADSSAFKTALVYEGMSRTRNFESLEVSLCS